MRHEKALRLLRCTAGTADITANLLTVAKVTPPPQVVRNHDEEDPYPRQLPRRPRSASLFDIANSVSSRMASGSTRHASGGSADYDHKKWPITARGGAWVSVTPHFQRSGHRHHKQDCTCTASAICQGRFR